VPVWLWRISGFCGYGDSVGIPTGFSVGMGWVWGLKFNPHGSPVLYATPDWWGFTVIIIIIIIKVS